MCPSKQTSPVLKSRHDDRCSTLAPAQHPVEPPVPSQCLHERVLTSTKLFTIVWAKHSQVSVWGWFSHRACRQSQVTQTALKRGNRLVVTVCRNSLGDREIFGCNSHWEVSCNKSRHLWAAFWGKRTFPPRKRERAKTNTDSLLTCSNKPCPAWQLQEFHDPEKAWTCFFFRWDISISCPKQLKNVRQFFRFRTFLYDWKGFMIELT